MPNDPREDGENGNAFADRDIADAPVDAIYETQKARHKPPRGKIMASDSFHNSRHPFNEPSGPEGDA